MSDTLWIHYARPRPHWYRLTDVQRREKQACWDTLAEQARNAGASRIGQYHIRGQHDFQTVELWHFPDAQAAFDYWTQLTAAAYNEWFAFANNIGLSLENPAYEHAGS
jgi:hypothetical protein